MGLQVDRTSVCVDNSTSVYLDDGTSVYASSSQSETVEVCTPIDEAALNFYVAKSNDDQGLVSGWANVAKNADGSIPLDWQDDVIEPEELEKAAINFMMDYRASGVQHEGDSKGVVVESMMFTKAKQEAIGIPEGCVPEGWFITVKVLDPEVFAKVKDGTLRMFSIQGRSKRIKQ